MEPNSGGNPTDNTNKSDTFASTIAAALAHLTGKDKETDNPDHVDSAKPSDQTLESVAQPGQYTTALGMYSTDSSGGVDDNVTSERAGNHPELKSEYKSDEPSLPEETDELQDAEMAEEEEATPSSTERQLRAVYGEHTVNVRVKANDEIVIDSVVVGEMERSISSTNTSADYDQHTVETEECPKEEEEHHHKHRTRSSSFDVAQAMVNPANHNLDHQETITSTTSSYNNPPPDFADASLLLGLTDSSTQVASTKPVRGELEPATLPTTMTFFLDMLNEEQRRVRHRHIPAVEGFRKLYKSEIKQDMSAARALDRKRQRVEESAIDDEEEMKEESDSSKTDVDDNKDMLPDCNAFSAPSENTIAFAHCGQLASLMESTPFENSMRGGMPVSSLRSPQLVESMTAFNPPRPQESTATKTKHRLKRWESNPEDVEVDLLNYKKTVQRTRIELHKAEDEHAQIEAVASMIRTHYMNHLDAYSEEIATIVEQLNGVRSQCYKAGEEYNGKTISTRGSNKTMKDVFVTLKSLGDDLGSKARQSGDENATTSDWRVSGIGGVAAPESSTKEMAKGWILVGDKVKARTGEEGTVVKINGVCLKEMSTSDKEKVDSSQKAEDSNAMDVDKPKTGAEAKPTNETSVVRPGIAVQLADGMVKSFSPSDLFLQSTAFPCGKDTDLIKRWETMTQSAIEIGSNHDYESMDYQVVASILQKQQEEDNDGSASPKSVTQYDDLRNVVPFGAGIMNAPDEIRSFSSIIPVNILEDEVRKIVYESGKDIQVIPQMLPSLEKYECQKEHLNKLKIKVLQLRNRLGRQKRIRGINELNLEAGKKRSDKVEGLLVEMQTDLSILKGRLQEELNELEIGKPVNTEEVCEMNNVTPNDINHESADAVADASKPNQPANTSVAEPLG